MTRILGIAAFLLLGSLVVYGQNVVIVDGDKLQLRDSLDGEVKLLSSIERGNRNQDALWITYNRRPGVDPWVRDLMSLEKNFIEYWYDNGVNILGAWVTYDNCLCYKNKRGDSPDMHLIHFKVKPNDWEKMKELYPELPLVIRKIN